MASCQELPAALGGRARAAQTAVVSAKRPFGFSTVTEHAKGLALESRVPMPMRLAVRASAATASGERPGPLGPLGRWRLPGRPRESRKWPARV